MSNTKTRKTKEMIKIDGERLKSAIGLKGMSLVKASNMIGASDAFLSMCINRGCIKQSTERLIDTVLGIPLGMYIPTKPVFKEPETEEQPEKPETPVEQPVVNVEIDYDEIQRCLYHAILGVVRKLQQEGSWL